MGIKEALELIVAIVIAIIGISSIAIHVNRKSNNKKQVNKNGNNVNQNIENGSDNIQAGGNVKVNTKDRK